MEQLSKFKFSRTGIAFATRIRKTRGSLFHTIPKEICLGCELKKGQELKNYLVHFADGGIGLLIPLQTQDKFIYKQD